MKKFFAEFKEFIMKGNVFGMAIGVVVGGAFTAIVKSFTDDIIGPIISIFTRKENLSTLTFEVGDAIIYYGNFLQAIITFLITAFVVFVMIKFITKLMKELDHSKEEEKKKTPTSEEYLKEILNILKDDHNKKA